VGETNGNFYYSIFHDSCTVPHPDGTGNTTNNPQFVNAAAANFGLLATSPCIDTGRVAYWMTKATDLPGNTRVIGSSVDMGAHELVFHATVRAFLQGPYDTNTHAMTADLWTDVARTSPYRANLRSVSAVPSNMVDWVLVELRDGEQNPVSATSAFLGTNGYVFSSDGYAGMVLEVPRGDALSLAIKHRNHLAAISSEEIAFTNRFITYDFTTGPDKYLTTNSTTTVESNVWALVAGDTDGDGKITETDRLIVSNQIGIAGYLQGDVNLDGKVEGHDMN